MTIETSDAGDGVAPIIAAFRAALPDPAKPMALLVRFAVGPGDGAKVEAAFAQAVPSTLREPGCLAFHLNREATDPGRFIVFERWRNLADLEAHLRTEYVTALRRALDPLLVGAPDFRVLLPAG